MKIAEIIEKRYKRKEIDFEKVQEFADLFAVDGDRESDIDKYLFEDGSSLEITDRGLITFNGDENEDY